MQIQGGETFTDVSPGKTVTSTRLNNHVNGGVLLKGAVAEQPELTVTAENDCVVVSDTSDNVTGTPKRVQLVNLSPETVRNGSKAYAAGTQSGGVYAVTLAPAATAYTAGMLVRFKADSANTGAVSLNVNALGNASLVGPSGQGLIANDIQSGQVVEVVYDGTNFQLVGTAAPNSVSPTKLSETARGGVHQYAAGTLGGTTYAVTLAPAATAYTTGMVVRFKAGSTNVGAVTLNVNALGNQGLTARGGVALAAGQILSGQMVTAVYDGAQFQAEAIQPVFVGTAAGTLAVGLAQFTHGLPAAPRWVRGVLVCTTNQAPFSVGDEVDLANVFDNSSGNQQFSVAANATNINVEVESTGVRTTSGSGTFLTITAGSWKVRVYAGL